MERIWVDCLDTRVQDVTLRTHTWSVPSKKAKIQKEME